MPLPLKKILKSLPQRKIIVGKTLDALAASRDGHESILRQFEKIPQSIMLHNKSDKSIDLMAEKNSYVSTMKLENRKNAFRAGGSGCQVGALSRFPQNVGRMLLLLYTNRGDTVVDPFAGHNSRMELCWRQGRHYIGQDLCAEFMQVNRTIREMLLKEKDDDLFPGTCSDASIELYEGDSRHMQAGDEVGDFTITSPPYYCQEYYGPEPEQLGTGSKTYEIFLDGLYGVMRENFRCLKSGAFCVWCVNDFRYKGKFISYHEDTAVGLRKAGFYQWDIAITDLGSSMRQSFPNQVVETKILPKRHEYCLVFRKP